MRLNALQEKQLLPIHQVPPEQVLAILICRNPLVRAGIRHMLDGTRYVVAGELEGSSTPSAASDASPVLYILDDSHSADALPETVADLKAQCPSARVVVLANHLDLTTMMGALRAGVDGLCSTKMGRDGLIRMLELVMLGETFMPAALALTMLNGMSEAHVSQPSMTPVLMPANNTATKPHNLTSREVEILRQLMEGESNKLIARRLDIAEATVRVHLKTILRKLRANNRTQAAVWASAHLSAAPDSMHIPQGGTNRV